MIVVPVEEEADKVAEAPPAVPSPSIGFANTPPGQVVRSAAVADIVPALSRIGTKTVTLTEAEQPAGL